MIATLVLALACLGASEPEIVTVRVPASRVGAWFPAGTDLQVLTADQFEDLAKLARAVPGPARTARLLKARHSARWSSGTLSGRTELKVDPAAASPAAAGPSFVPLEPWSPALLGSPEIRDSARVTADGRLGLKIEPNTPPVLALDWQLRAGPGTEGRGFTLGLPDLDPSTLDLDLPTGLVPEIDAGVRVGPEPGVSPGRSSWRFDGARGRIRLRLLPGPEEGPRPDGPRLWLEGPTRIDLNASPANWRAEWTLEASPGAPDRLTIELDPGVELLDVSGPRVASFRVEPKSPGRRVAVALRKAEPGVAATPLVIRGNCQAPPEGTWPVPGARPVDAIWTGGRVSVRIDPSRVLQGCVERSGRRVSARGSDPSDPSALVFEPGMAAGPVAELSFRKPSADATVDVQGWLKLDRERPEIDVALTWTVERGQLLSHDADLAPGWVPDRATTADGQAIPWHAEALTHGGTRVHLTPSPLDMEQRTLTVIFSASLRRLGSSGPLELPRVRPAPGSGKVADEVWVAPRSEKLAVRPIQGRGLAWIDPPSPSAAPAPAAPWASADLRGALAWRWLLDDADGGIECIPARTSARARIRLDASIVAGRLRLDYSLAIDPDASGLRTVPIHLDAEVAEAPSWQPAEPSGPEVVSRALDAGARASAGFAEAGSAWELVFSKVPSRPFELKSRVELPWSGSGTIPLLTVPARFGPSGLVAIRVEEATRCRVESSGLGRIDRPSSASGTPMLPDATQEERGLRLRLAGLFEQGPGGGRISATTSTGLPGPAGGLVREATLASQVFAGSGLRHRLTLAIHAETARAIDLTFPPALILDRIRRDGQAVPVVPVGPAIRIDLPAPTAARPSTSLTIEYRSEDLPGPRSGPLRLDSILPTGSLPCLSFVWEVATPEEWEVDDPSPGLLATDPRPARSRRERLLGLGGWPDGGATSRAPLADREAILLEFDAVPGSLKEGDAGLGDWLLRLDAGRRPVVVDRLAVREAGLGPTTRVASSASSALALQALGLTAEPVGPAILITTPAEVSLRSDPVVGETSMPWLDAIRLAAVEGADASDRYQSAGRWKGEATPRALSAGESTGRPSAARGWHVRRFAAAGWPARPASVRIDDRATGLIRGWALTLLILALATLARFVPWKPRASAISLLLGLSAILFGLSWPVPSDPASGILRGALAALAAWTVRAGVRRVRGLDRPMIATLSARVRSAAGGVAGAGIGLMGVGLVVACSASGAGPERPILALLPEEGIPGNLASRPDRVLMRVDDYERLRRLGHPRPPAARDRAFLTSAEHRIDREGRDLAVVVSRYGVEVNGEGPATWDMPIGQALDLSASVDDNPVPLDIAADAGKAVVNLAGPGQHKVEFRRYVRLETVGDSARRVRVSIQRAAFARASVGRDPDGRAVGLPGALGQEESRDGGAEGLLGPIDVLEVRWWPGDRSAPPPDPGDLDASILWDASARGDLVRARLVHSGPEPLSSLRFEVEPGVQARSFAIPGATMIQQSGRPGRPEWVVALDPPLPAGVPFEAEFWRSAEAGPSPRSLPRFRLVGARRFTGILGFRRPSDWSGRLDVQEALKPLEEAEFVRVWGALPGVGLTLAGTARFEALPAVATTISLPGRRRSVRTELRCELGPGRLGATLDAVLSDREGRSFEAEVGLPTDFRVARLEAEGLVDWQRSGRDRVRLQFNGAEIRDRRMHLEGFVPAPTDSALAESRSYLAQVPWPRWYGVEAESGQLILSCPNRFTFDPAPRDAPRLTLGPGSGTNFLAAYQVDRPEGLGPIRWSSPPSLVGVSVRSDLVINPSGVTWTADVGCEVSGGPAESLHWRIPSDWAERATLEVDGIPARPAAEVKGETTFWTITPASPIWGHARLVLRSTRPIAPGRAFSFPEIAPLSAPGRGTLDRYDLAIANLTGRPLEVAGSAGLQAIDVSQYRSAVSSAPAGSIGWAYHVTGDRWSLQVRLGGPDGPTAGEGDDRPVLVESAHLCLSVAPGGSTWGCAHYALGPRPGPFFGFTLPEPGSIPWASVDGRRAVALRDPAGRWSIPLGEGSAKRVDFCWTAPDQGQRLALPSLDQAGVATTIRTFAPGSVGFSSPSGAATGLDPAGWQLAIAEPLAARIVATMADFDRTSQVDRRTLVEDLARFELCGRAVARGHAGREATARFGSLRTSVEDAGQDSGLEDAIEEARILVGLLPPAATPPAPGPIATGEPLRIRHLGPARGFRATSPGGGRPIDLEFQVAPARVGWSRIGFGSAAAACLVSSGWFALGFRRGRPRRTTFLS